MASEKQVEVLDNKTEIKTTKEGWNAKDLKDVPAQAAGWKERAAPHFSVGLGMLKAVADKDMFVLGNYDADGTLVPIIDAPALTQDILETYAEAKGLDVQTIRIAGSRTGAKKELDSLKETFADIDPKTMDILEKSNPDAFAAIMKLQA